MPADAKKKPQAALDQYGAVCYRKRKGKVQVLLITSRARGRWIMPKGWPMDGLDPHETALQEAWEEAGVVGRAEDQIIGHYDYERLRGKEKGETCRVTLYPVKVKATAKRYPEMAQRKRRWVSPKKAGRLLAEPELAQTVIGFGKERAKKKA